MRVATNGCGKRVLKDGEKNRLLRVAITRGDGLGDFKKKEKNDQNYNRR